MLYYTAFIGPYAYKGFEPGNHYTLDITYLDNWQVAIARLGYPLLVEERARFQEWWQIKNPSSSK